MKLWKQTVRPLTVLSVNSDALAAKYDSARIRALCYHSRSAVGGTVFFCLVGKTADGHSYAQSAYDAGCRIFVCEHFVELPEDALQVTVPNAREALADCAAAYYDHPDRSLRLIGLTGTKGKTTTALLIRDVLCAAGIPTGYIGTCGVDFSNEHYDTVNSTPESVDIYRYLAMMRDAGMAACALEISSQGLWMKRTRGLVFDTTIFLNLHRDHIGGVEHPDMTHYRMCKKKLFSDYPTRTVIVNRDDAASEYMLEDLPVGQAAPRVLTFSILSESIESELPPALFTASDIRPERVGARIGVGFACRHAGERAETWFLPMPGRFNVQNALAVLSVVCECFGVSLDTAKEALAHASVPGRFETVTHPGLPRVTFIIDYAHNGVSLASILDALREYNPRHLIALFGSVGGRTYERRRDLAEAAAERCELCILTSDNPANEPPEDILHEIDAAFPAGSCPRLLIPDRAEAIRRAVEAAGEGDIVLLAGKGHEQFQLIGTKKVPFSERGILLEAIETRIGAGVL